MLHLNNVSFEIAGRSLFNNINLILNQKKYALVGPNGSGKSTLARLIAGTQESTSGEIIKNSSVALFLQSEKREQITVAEYLTDIWQTSTVSSEFINQLIQDIDFSRSLPQLSGGEWVKIRLAKLIAENTNFIIFDEPTNNLDRKGKELIIDFVKSFKGGLLIISHDKELLREADVTLELSNQNLSVFGGGFDFYWEQRELERHKQQQDLTSAKNNMKKVERSAVEKIDRQVKRQKQGAKQALSGSLPRILIGGRKRQAEKSMGKLVKSEQALIDESNRIKIAAFDQIKVDPFIRFDFASAKPPTTKMHFYAENLQLTFREQNNSLWKNPLNFIVRGSERWHIRGANGSGKSTLLSLLMGKHNPALKTQFSELKIGQTIFAYLDQDYGLLNTKQSLIENISSHSRFTMAELRNELAFFGFAGETCLRPTASLSGGELLKASLAKALLGPQLPEILIADEPTNNLDLPSQQLLAQAFNIFQGAIVLVSHDQDFVSQIKIDKLLTLE